MKASSKPRDVRKIKYTPEQVKDIYMLMEIYIDARDFPTLAGFLAQAEIRHKFKLTYQYIYDHPEVFGSHISVMKSKCEDYLVKQGLAGRAMPMTIFLLKQMQFGGYSDQQQIDLTSQSQPIKFINSVPRPRKSSKR